MKDSLNGTWVVRDSSQGKGMCHRAQFVVIPKTLGQFIVSRPPCTGASCALWDDINGHCHDVTSSRALTVIAGALQTLKDHLPAELP